MDGFLLWLGETFLGFLYRRLTRPKAIKTVAQNEAENFAKPVGSDDETINNL